MNTLLALALYACRPLREAWANADTSLATFERANDEIAWHQTRGAHRG